MKLKSYPKYKDSGIKWIGEIPEGWEAHRIKSFVPYIKNGQWGDDSSGGNKDFIVLRVADFLEFNFNLNKELTIRNIKDTKLRLKEGDLVIEKSGGGEKQIVGRVVQLKNSSKEKKYTYSNFIGKLEISHRMNNTFLNYYFKAFYNNRVNFNYIKQTTGIQNLDSESLIQREYFAYPIDKNYQKSIVSFLDKKIAEIDELIKKDKKLIELLKEKRSALINYAVTKGLPVLRTQIGFNPNANMKDSGIDWIGEIPEGWEVHKMKYNIYEKKIKDTAKNPSTKFIGLEHIESETGKLISSSTLEEIDGESIRFKENNVLFGKLRPYLAKVIITDFQGSCTGELIVYETGEKIDPKFLFYRLLSKSFINLVTSTTYGVKMPRADPTQLGNIKIAWPSLTEQIAIAIFLDKFTARVNNTIQKIQRKINFLEEYKKSLIHHTVTGKIDIREVKI